MRFLKHLNPLPGIKDFWSEFSRPNPYRWRILAVSAALTFCLFYLMIPEDEVGLPKQPEITYITTFAAGRSDAEIRASNIAAQKRKDAAEALAKAQEEERKALYRTLGKATGLDTDAMERKIAADEAREKAAKEAEAAHAAALRAKGPEKRQEQEQGQ